MIYDSTLAGAAVSFILFLSSLNGVDAGTSVKAVPAIQNLNRRAIYQGGWPLALLGSASTTCPDEAPVKCASKSVNPACCPGGQTCIYGSGQYANYCCPTSADCNTAVINFPQCANTTWTMFRQSGRTYFCCPPGLIGINPVDSNGGLCEPPDQVVPASLLATVYPQATATPSSTQANNTIAGNPNQANPTASATTTSDASKNSANGTTDGTKLAVAFAAVAVIALLVIVGCIRRWKRRNAVVQSVYYDEEGNPIYRYGYNLAERPHEQYRKPFVVNTENNVTLNVVHGDSHR